MYQWFEVSQSDRSTFSLIIYIPIWLNGVREFLRKQSHSTFKPTATDLTIFVMCQPLLRHGVHVHSGSGGCGSSVGLYLTNQFITFSNDDLLPVASIDDLLPVDSKGVDWSLTTHPLTFQVLRVDNRLHTNTESLNPTTHYSTKLPTVLDEGFYTYLSSFMTSPLSPLSCNERILDGHFAMEKRDYR
jgi:hypothetical protein